MSAVAARVAARAAVAGDVEELVAHVHRLHVAVVESAERLESLLERLAAAGASLDDPAAGVVERGRTSALQERVLTLRAVDGVRRERTGEFRRDGDYWSIAFRAGRVRLTHSKGLGHIAHLLACPGVEVHALELVGACERHPPTGHQDGLDRHGAAPLALIDATARVAYRRRLDELAVELDEARAFNDPERAARAREEMAFIAGELEAVHGLGGRARHAACPAERARQSVAQAVRRARERIARECPALERHLADTLQTGIFCSYMPGSHDRVDWRL